MQQREYPRLPFREHILVDGLHFCTSTDISEGGMFISAIQYFEEGSVVELSIPVREGKIEVKAQVKYAQAGIGAGVMFLDLTDEEAAGIRELTKSQGSEENED